MKFTISLASEQDRPNRNGHIFTRPVLDQIVEHLNKASVPVTLVSREDGSVPVPVGDRLGETILGSARVENGRVMLEIDASKLPENFRPMLGFGAFAASLENAATVLNIDAVHSVALTDA